MLRLGSPISVGEGRLLLHKKRLPTYTTSMESMWDSSNNKKAIG